MPDRTKIEWADATWNPIAGCSKISPGCANCYAERMARRLARIPNTRDIYFPLLDDRDRWNGATILNENALFQPFRWRKPRRIFVGSMTDLFHESTPDAWLDQVFAVMERNERHTFLVLTKRPDRMRDYVLGQFKIGRWPLPNVWLGVTVENQEAAERRIPILLLTSAAMRFISCEPLLGPINLRQSLVAIPWPGEKGGLLFGLDWVICGGESGPKARPMDPGWVRSLRDQCQAAGAAFLFKQWGEWAHEDDVLDAERRYRSDLTAGRTYRFVGTPMRRVGKKRAGRLLDGREWNEVPE